MTDKIKGTVKFFNPSKGYGFIIPDNGGQDIFIHMSQLSNMGNYVEEGQTLRFNVEQGRKGLEAKNAEIA